MQKEQQGKIQALESEINLLRQEKESWSLQRENVSEKKSKDQVRYRVFIIHFKFVRNCGNKKLQCPVANLSTF